MTRKMFLSFGFLLAVFAILVAFQRSALAGPPLICFSYDIGGAKSLPWGGASWDSPKADYDLGRLVEDTRALLTPDAPVIVRMETLRRAAIYAQKNQRIANELLARLLARAREAEASGRPDALAWFDVGYLVESYKQLNWVYKKTGAKPPAPEWAREEKPNPATGLDGYAWVLKALSLRGKDPEMEFAAAITSCTEYRNWVCTDESQKQRHNEHLRKATAGATGDSLLVKNLLSRFGHRGGTIAELRAKYGKAEK